jgi:hypothetical protein
MFGYRLLRDRDFDAMKVEVSSLREKVEGLQEIRAGLLRELATATATAESRGAHLDSMLPVMNKAIHDAAQLQSKLTGLPMSAPQVGRGNPLMAEGGAGVDLFNDVGDDRAAELEKMGLLSTPSFPHAADLAPTG